MSPAHQPPKPDSDYDYLIKIVLIGEAARTELFQKLSNLNLDDNGDVNNGDVTKVTPKTLNPADLKLRRQLNRNFDFEINYLELSRGELVPTPVDSNRRRLRYKFYFWSCSTNQVYRQPNLFRGASIILVSITSHNDNKTLYNQLLAQANITEAIVAFVTNSGDSSVGEKFKTVTNAVISYNFDFTDSYQITRMLTDVVNAAWMKQLVNKIKT